MDRREFLKVVGFGSMALFVSGCGLNTTANNDQSAGKIPEQNNVSGGKSMKIVVINSSPHSDSESTSKYLAQRFTEGAKSTGHEVFTFDADRQGRYSPLQGLRQVRNEWSVHIQRRD